MTTTTATIPAESLRSLGLHEGDRLRILEAKGAEFVVEIDRRGEGMTTAESDALSEWLRTAKGTARLAPGETVDDARMAYYRGKFKLNG